MIRIDLHIATEDDRWNHLNDISIESFLKTYIHSVLNDPRIQAKIPKHVEISVLLTHDDEIKKLNAHYRGKNQPTNVLSFPQEENLSSLMNAQACVLLGDIVLSIETIHIEAVQQEKLIHHHLAHLIVHGTLHLLGYDHETDEEAEEMEALEVNILKQHHIQNPYGPDMEYMV